MAKNSLTSWISPFMEAQGFTRSQDNPWLFVRGNAAGSGGSKRSEKAHATSVKGLRKQAETGSVNRGDVAAAQFADRDQYLKAVNDYRNQWAKAGEFLGTAMQQPTGQLYNRADRVLGMVTDAASGQGSFQNMDRVLETADTIKERAGDLGQRGEEIYGQEAAFAAQQKADAMQMFKDTSAQQVEQQRRALDTQARQRKEQVLSQAYASGMDANDPAVQGQLQEIDNWKFQQLGSMANDAAISYNKTRAQLLNTYDQMELTQRQFGASTAMQGRQGEIAGLAQAGQLEKAWADVMNASFQAGVQAYTQLSSLGAQMEMQGYGLMADWIREAPVAFSPVAGIVADLYAMGSDAGSQASSFGGGSGFQSLGTWGSPIPGTDSGGFRFSREKGNKTVPRSEQNLNPEVQQGQGISGPSGDYWQPTTT
jgi:hypothetical protein